VTGKPQARISMRKLLFTSPASGTLNSIRSRADLGLVVVRLMGIEFVLMLFGASVALALAGAGEMSVDAVMGRRNTVP
jgi:hypothetical protein